MKILIFLFLLSISLYSPLLSQNLVPNYNFSRLDSCPYNKGQIFFAPPWYSSNGKTTDLIHTCNTNNIAGVPDNKWGTQYPFDGNGMAGIRTYLSGENIEPNYREYLAVQLNSRLIKNEKYYISFKASPAENNKYYSDNLALYISSQRIPSSPFLNVKPTISNNNGYMNAFDAWYDISGEYLADGDENFLVIGNFNDDENTNLVEQFQPENKEESAYYYIDNVVVRSCRSIWPEKLINYSSDSICSGESANLSVNFEEDEMISFFWQDSLSLNSAYSVNEPGIYTLTVNYNDLCQRTDTIVISNTGIDIDLGADTTLCPGQELQLAIEPDDNASVIWEDGSSEWQRTIQRSGLYSMKINKNNCVTKDTILVDYVDPTNLIDEKDTSICKGQSFILDVEVGDSNYQWSNGQTKSKIEVNSTGLYAVNISNKCFFHNSQFFVTVASCGCDANIPNVITPNGDGLNDLFEFELPIAAELIELIVFNRWGQEIFSSNSYENFWNGTYNHKKATPGVYFFNIKYKCINKNGEQQLKINKGSLSVLH